jgi:hypothetical protein
MDELLNKLNKIKSLQDQKLLETAKLEERLNQTKTDKEKLLSKMKEMGINSVEELKTFCQTKEVEYKEMIEKCEKALA